MVVAQIVKCLKCNKTIQSKYRHDYQECGCPNRSIIDGGIDYSRYGAVDMSMIEHSVVTTEDTHERIRETFYWGRNMDKDRNILPETEWILLKDLDDGHLEVLITYKEGNWIGKLFLNERNYRNDKN